MRGKSEIKNHMQVRIVDNDMKVSKDNDMKVRKTSSSKSELIRPNHELSMFLQGCGI